MLFFLGIAFLSTITLYSAGNDFDGRFAGHIRNLSIAVLIMWLVAHIPPVMIHRVAVPLFVVGLLLLLAVALFGDVSKGARRWLNIGITRIQPSELMKIAMPMMLAWLVHRVEGLRSIQHWFMAVLLLMVPTAFILAQPDLGTAILVFSAGLFVLFFAGLPWRLVLVALGIAVIGVLLLIVFGDVACADGVNWPGLREYQRQRVCTLLDPMRDPLGKGFHIIQSIIAVGSGGIFGKGWMQGTQTHLEFIPERTTDFLFAAYSEEFGLLGNLLLLSLYAGLILRGLWIAIGAPTLFSRLLAGAISLTIFNYAFVNMGMVTGVLPVVGVPLPWMSYGGTAMVTLGFGAGILMSIARTRSQTVQGFVLQRSS
ncbi:MAG: rod shape-determining protein RodA [Betaproteobacteria bacterium]|nr:rod shape-determining protein RodA [Betaproteobacteria bacterium]